MKSPSEITWPETILAALTDFQRFGDLRSARIVDRTAQSWVCFLTRDVDGGKSALLWADQAWLRLRPELGERLTTVCAELRKQGWRADWAPARARRIQVRASTDQWPHRWYSADRRAMAARAE